MDDIAVINQKEPQDAAKKSQEIIAQKLLLGRIGDMKLIPAFHLKAMLWSDGEQDMDSSSQDSYVDKIMSQYDR